MMPQDQRARRHQGASELAYSPGGCKFRRGSQGAVASASAPDGRLDIIVNNAGYSQFGCTEDVSISEFREQFETNFFSIDCNITSGSYFVKLC